MHSLQEERDLVSFLGSNIQLAPEISSCLKNNSLFGVVESCSCRKFAFLLLCPLCAQEVKGDVCSLSFFLLYTFSHLGSALGKSVLFICSLRLILIKKVKASCYKPKCDSFEMRPFLSCESNLPK